MKLPIEQACQIAKANLSRLHGVQEWSDIMGYESCKYFSRLFRNYYGERPKIILTQLKIDRFAELIKSDIRDEIALYKFMKRHTGRSPTEWKNG